MNLPNGIFFKSVVCGSCFKRIELSSFFHYRLCLFSVESSQVATVAAAVVAAVISVAVNVSHPTQKMKESMQIYMYVV